MSCTASCPAESWGEASHTFSAKLVERASKRILRFLQRRGVIPLVTVPGDGEVTVVTDETLAEKDPLLAKLLAAATAGAAPAVERIASFADYLIENTFALDLDKFEDVDSVVVLNKRGVARTIPASSYAYDPPPSSCALRPMLRRTVL